jgi:hypothetical protein
MGRKKKTTDLIEDEGDNKSPVIKMTLESEAHKKTALAKDLADPRNEDSLFKVYVKNWLVPNGISLFPELTKARIVDKYFPFAVGGPLLVDEPEYDEDVKVCEAKAEKLQSLGVRYIFIKPKSDFFEAMGCLNELDDKLSRSKTINQ